MSNDAPCYPITIMAKSLNQAAADYQAQNPDSSIELAFIQGARFACQLLGKQDDKAKEKLEARRVKFKQALSLFVPKYGATMIIEFYEYWSELNPSGTKMRYEQQKTWELSKRLTRWANNNNKYDNNRNNFGKRKEKGNSESLFAFADSVLQGYRQ